MNKTKKKEEIIANEEFKRVINEIKTDITTTRVRTIREVNTELILLYFRIGKVLEENSKYGNGFIKNISTEIRLSFPGLTGFSDRNLKYMKRFYNEYNEDDEKVQQLVAQIPWGHNVILMEKIKDKDIRKIYIEASIKNGWSRSVLEAQIDTKYHERIGKSDNNFKQVLNGIDSDLVNNTLKDPYIFDFISLKGNYKEKDLEKRMLERIKNVDMQ